MLPSSRPVIIPSQRRSREGGRDGFLELSPMGRSLRFPAFGKLPTLGTTLSLSLRCPLLPWSPGNSVVPAAGALLWRPPSAEPARRWWRTGRRPRAPGLWWRFRDREARFAAWASALSSRCPAEPAAALWGQRRIRRPCLTGPPRTHCHLDTGLRGGPGSPSDSETGR